MGGRASEDNERTRVKLQVQFGGFGRRVPAWGRGAEAEFAALVGHMDLTGDGGGGGVGAGAAVEGGCGRRRGLGGLSTEGSSERAETTRKARH